MSWFLDSGRSLLNVVGEVVAPSVKTPLEEFKNNWNVIKNFYLDEQCKRHLNRYEQKTGKNSAKQKMAPIQTLIISLNLSLLL
jgi:hypothetical protein